jgi:hypothetical protein
LSREFFIFRSGNEKDGKIGYYETDILITTLESVASNYSISLTWGLDSSPVFTYELVAYEDYALPTWVSLNEDESKLQISAPEQFETQTYILGLQTTADGVILIRKISVTVVSCSAAYCETWLETDINTWTKWISGYIFFNGDSSNWVSSAVSSSVSNSKFASQGLLGVGVAAAIGTSILTKSSPQAAYAMINQIQLLMLIPLLGAYLDPDIFKFIQGMNFAILSANILPSEGIGSTSIIKDILDYPQPNDYLSELGMKSGSAFLNQIQLIYTWCLFLSWHSFILMNYISSSRPLVDSKFHSTIRDVFEWYTFGAYIRFFIESFLLLLLAIMTEIIRFDFSDSIRSLNFLISWWMLGFIFGVWLISYLKAGKQYCQEYFTGVKKRKYARMYSFVFLWKRFIFWSLLAMLYFLPLILKICKHILTL